MIIFSINGVGTTGYHMGKKKKRNLDTDLTSFTKNDSKQTIGLNGKC